MVDDLENRGRKNNLLFRGLSPSDQADCVDLSDDFCRNQMEVDADFQIDRVHFLNCLAAR